jgi:DNA repair protein RecO (recombination protein O)
MEWSDDALVISTRRHGETSVIASLLSRDQGRFSGLVRGGAGKNKRGILQPGNLVHATWRARLPEHLGSFTCEMVKPLAASVMDDPMRLMALSSACAVCATVLPEREAHPGIYDGLLILLENMNVEEWSTLYVKWELGLLGELGFGLDLSECASTGDDQDLIYVSPKSGKAVSAQAGEPYKDRLLTLPPFFLQTNKSAYDMREIIAGLRLTGFFLNRHAYEENNQNQPDARSRFVQSLSNRSKQQN